MKNKEACNKILEYVEKIESYCAGMDYQAFISDTRTVEACVFNLSLMGEMVNRLDDTFIEQHHEIPWHKIRGLRNRIVHDYEGVNLSLVWDIIELDLEELKKQLDNL